MMQEDNIEFYKQIYKELCEKGYMTREEFKARVKGHNVYHVYRALDSLNLFTYDDKMIIEKNGKLHSVVVVKPC